eukprot:CAMPEP_0184749596 /NCGR_PEP_ID=MMETSP0315-20130426/29261_1 /TAXON_ID=101924 /ORGANISM="Rhodosorus marinus, Strain UTEX LB 2760" /LENGTH=32 /DNA_ID= /DNA_START= /DNA_END= /DNA_ORIENTATION=
MGGSLGLDDGDAEEEKRSFTLAWLGSGRPVRT